MIRGFVRELQEWMAALIFSTSIILIFYAIVIISDSEFLYNFAVIIKSAKVARFSLAVLFAIPVKTCIDYLSLKKAPKGYERTVFVSGITLAGSGLLLLSVLSQKWVVFKSSFGRQLNEQPMVFAFVLGVLITIFYSSFLFEDGQSSH